MVRKVFEKAGLIQGFQPTSKVAGERPSAIATDIGKPRTAPGTMMGFLTAQSQAVQEAEHLKSRVKELEGAAPLRKLDPKSVFPSRWANRHEASFSEASFAELKDEIAASGGNIQPIKVRPRAVLDDPTQTEGVGFEIVFGHRRHRACFELGLPVLAAVEAVTDVELFEQMERENRGRKNLSAWEQGMMYRRALDEGLFPSLRRMAEALAVDVSQISRGIALARLPDDVISAFKSPLDIQFKWAASLTEVLQKDPEGMLERARTAAEMKDTAAPARVFERLIGKINDDAAALKGTTQKIRKDGKLAASLSVDPKGGAVVRFEPGAVPERHRKSLAKLIEDFLKSC